jgi:hypothetical protein
MKHIIVFILIFFINNSNLFSQTEETWSELNSYDRLEGEWEGRAISHVRNNFGNTEFESNLHLTMTFNYKNGEAIVSSIVKFDFTDYLTDLANREEMKENGYTIESIWEILKGEMEDDFFTFGHYSLFYENSALAIEYFASDSRGYFLIDKNEDTLLLIYYEPSFILGIGDSGFTEMIFKKLHKASIQ